MWWQEFGVSYALSLFIVSLCILSLFIVSLLFLLLSQFVIMYRLSKKISSMKSKLCLVIFMSLVVMDQNINKTVHNLA